MFVVFIVTLALTVARRRLAPGALMVARDASRWSRVRLGQRRSECWASAS